MADKPVSDAPGPGTGSAGEQAASLEAPAGFHVYYLSQMVPGARFMAFAPNGDLLVSEPSAGDIVVIPHGSSPEAQPRTFATGLSLPHGLAFFNGKLYVATWSGVVRYDYPSNRATTLFANMPQGGDHNMRALAIGGDGAIYVSSGSDCNVCDESDSRFATVLRYGVGDRNGSIFAKGLRNASGLAFDANGRLWAVVNQRDNIGTTQVTDNLPPDELDLVQSGDDMGWPRCYPDHDHAARSPNPEYANASCAATAPAALNFQAHSAPLGVAFYYANQFPASYKGGAFVAFHGSWNRSTRTGDKVVFVRFSGGRPISYQDFVTGWLRSSGYEGRPVGVAVAPDGSIAVSDDRRGYIYRIVYRR
ncbi:MAG: PQQ-dependent sugar dehydrogenase [Candidatus Eremiobacter antarcticus]|nr:PQQ-dependent sugar dehydrogenase [Candidatus Eremiobacteraeota bacterium]MBC5807541.1 PQQ-dependent sugar dehydrogenase [Candidatus Eremiobacteraeota bacterium]